MDFINDDGGARLGFDDADDVIANEEFSSWLNTQLPVPPQGPQPQPEPSPQSRMSAASLGAPHAAGSNPAMGQPRRPSPAPQISPKTQSGTPNPYNAWKNSSMPPSAPDVQRPPPSNGVPGYDGPLHGRTPSVVAEMSRYMAQMPSQRMMQQQQQQQNAHAGSQAGLGMPPGMQQNPQMPQGPLGPNADGSRPLRDIPSRQGGHPMDMPHAMGPIPGRPMSQASAMPQGMPPRAASRMHAPPNSMSPALQHRQAMMSPGMAQGPQGHPSLHGSQGPQGPPQSSQGMSAPGPAPGPGPIAGSGPMGSMPPRPSSVYASQQPPSHMMNGNVPDGRMPYPSSMHTSQPQNSPAIGEGALSPQMGAHMPPNMYGAGPQPRMSVSGAPPTSTAASRRGKRRPASAASNPAVAQTPGAAAQSPVSVAQSPRPTPTPGSAFSPNLMGPQMLQGPPLSRPMSRPGSRVGVQQSPQHTPISQSHHQAPQMHMQHQAAQSGPAGPGMMQRSAQASSMGQGMGNSGPAPHPMQSQPLGGPQGTLKQGGIPRAGNSADLHVYAMSNDGVRLALIALSLYTQVHKFGPQSIAMKEILRRIDTFPALEQRRMVEKFEISRGGAISELARLPIARVIQPIFWRTLLECYGQLGIAPIPQSVSLGSNGPQIALFPLFQAVQSVGGYIDATLTGRWPVVHRMLELPSQGSLSPLEIIWVYATTLLPFEVYASQHEPIRRQLASQLAPPRRSLGTAATAAAAAAAASTTAQANAVASTPGAAQRAGSPPSGPGGLGANDIAGPMSAGSDMRIPAQQRSSAAQRMRAPPTQQAPTLAQTQVRAPQRRAPPNMPQPGMVPPGQTAMHRDSVANQQAAASHMGAPVDQMRDSPMNPAASMGRPPSVTGMHKASMNNDVQGMGRGSYMDPSASGPGAQTPNRQASGFIPAGLAGAGPGGIAMGPQDAAQMPHLANRHVAGHMQGPMASGPSANMSHRLLQDNMHPNVVPLGMGTAEAQVGGKRAAFPEDEARKRSRIGGPRHAEQLRREAQGKNTFGALSENGEYLLQRRHSSTHGGRNVRYLSALGNEIENWRPEVAFPLDLGIVDLHAVTLSLASQHPAEVRQTLDKLIVVSANPRVHESLQHCPRLLANLCKLVMNMIDQLLEVPRTNKKLLHSAVRSTEAEIVDDDVELLARGSKGLVAMNEILKKYKRDSGEEIVIEVDSQTGVETGTRSRCNSRQESDTEPLADKPAEPALQACSSTEKDQGSEKRDDENNDKPFYYYSYGTRYQRIDSEICTLEKPPDEMSSFLMTSLCDRLLLATCVLRNLSFSESNRPVIARKPEFLQLLWRLLEMLGTRPKLLDSELRTLDLCKDILTVLGNVALYVQLHNPRDTLKLMLFLLSFAPVESPFTETGELKLMDYDIDVHRYLPNAIDVFAKIAPRETPNRKLVEEVLLGTCEDPGYKELIGRWLKAQGRTELYPAELLSRMFSLAIAMMPFTHFRPPSRDIDTRQPYLLQATMAAELLVNMIPDDEDDHGVNIALSWLESVEHFGARMVRTLNFMGMVVVNQPEVNGEYMRPFAKITQRGVNVVQRLFKKAKRSSDFNGSGIVPTIEHLLGGLMAAKMDKVVVKHLNALYDESTQLQKDEVKAAKTTAPVGNN